MIQKANLFDLVGYKPHSGQQLIHDAVVDNRHTIAVCGRRFGKTHLATHEALYHSLQPNDKFGPPIVYLVSDTYDHAKKLFNPIATLFENKLKPFKEKVYLKDLTVVLKSGAEIKAKSADNPSSLAGDGVSFVVIDESGFIANYAIEVLYPSLTNRLAKALVIGTPDNRSWFYDWYILGLNENTGYKSFQMGTDTNPLFDKDELERIRNTTPESVFRKYYLANWLDDDSTAFRQSALEKIFHEDLAPRLPEKEKRYVIGLDLAQTVDYTVITVLDISEDIPTLVYFDRFNKTAWDVVAERVKDVATRYNNATVYLDHTGIGGPVFEIIQKRYYNLQGIKFTQASKMNLIQNLIVMIEQQKLRLFNQNVLKAELISYRAVSTPNGIKYDGPPGTHDDSVISLALACHGIQSRRAIPQSAIDVLTSF